MRIIIVDDEPNALHVFLDGIMLKQDVEYKFFKDDLQLILNYVEEKQVDAAFLDIKMPNVDGITLAEELISKHPEIKLVFITGLNASMKDLPPAVKERTVGFVYKPYDSGELLSMLDKLSDVAMHLRVTMSGAFECYINERPVEFSSAKSKEMFALLLAYNGKTLTMTDAISMLWIDHDVDKSKILYRDAVWRLRKTLQKINFSCVDFSRGRLILNKENITCDFWEHIENKTLHEVISDNFLKEYEWSAELLALIKAAEAAE